MGMPGMAPYGMGGMMHPGMMNPYAVFGGGGYGGGGGSGGGRRRGRGKGRDYSEDDASEASLSSQPQQHRRSRSHAPTPSSQRTAMKKFRIVILGFGTARQKRVLE
jgi:hypothetical protein